MYEIINKVVKDPVLKTAVGIGALTIVVLTGVHYYHQIKLTRLKIDEMEGK